MGLFIAFIYFVTFYISIGVVGIVSDWVFQSESADLFYWPFDNTFWKANLVISLIVGGWVAAQGNDDGYDERSDDEIRKDIIEDGLKEGLLPREIAKNLWFKTEEKVISYAERYGLEERLNEIISKRKKNPNLPKEMRRDNLIKQINEAKESITNEEEDFELAKETKDFEEAKSSKEMLKFYKEQLKHMNEELEELNKVLR